MRFTLLAVFLFGVILAVVSAGGNGGGGGGQGGWQKGGGGGGGGQGGWPCFLHFPQQFLPLSLAETTFCFVQVKCARIVFWPAKLCDLTFE